MFIMVGSVFAAVVVGLCVAEGEWSECQGDDWVPFRRDGKPDADYSFHACIHKSAENSKPDWETSHRACARVNGTLAHWNHWKELAFFYHAFQRFKQTLTSPVYFMVLLNLREKPFPQYTTTYGVYDKTTDRVDVLEWNYLRETMINIKYRRYAEPTDKKDLDRNCGAFRMHRGSFVNSDIDFVPCDARTYRESLVYDIQNDLSHFLCRRERAACPTVTRDTLGYSVKRIEGIYSHYYGTIRNREQVPNTNLLVNVTSCHHGCDFPNEAGAITYYSGDWLHYWCITGYRASNHGLSWEGSYAECGADGAWQYEPCTLASPCSAVACRNGGTPYENGDTGECSCDCVERWSGEMCELEITDYPCHSSPCLNDGVCVVDARRIEGFRCECAGAMGEHCQFELNECTSNPCDEGSLCVDQADGYVCVCDPLKQGKHCNEVVPYCTRFTEPCKNGADCYSCNLDIFKGWCERENRTQYMCNCKIGFTGSDCSIKLEEKLDAWQIFSIVLGCMLFIIVSLFCEIIGSRRRHDHDNLQVLLESIDGYLKQQQQMTQSDVTNQSKAKTATRGRKRDEQPASTRYLTTAGDEHAETDWSTFGRANTSSYRATGSRINEPRSRSRTSRRSRRDSLSSLE